MRVKILFRLAIAGIAAVLAPAIGFSQDLLPLFEKTEAVVPMPVKSEAMGQARLIVTAESQVRTPRIYFGDVGSCEGLRELCEEISAMEIGTSAPPGEVKTLSRDDLEELLIKEFPALRVETVGPDKIKVKSEAVEVEKQALETALRNVLQHKVKRFEHLRIAMIRVLFARKLSVWPGTYKLDVPVLEMLDFSNSEQVFSEASGRRIWDVSYVPSEPTLGQHSLRVSVHIELEVLLPVAKTAIRAGRAITEDDLEMRWQLLTRQNLAALGETNQLVGRRLRGDLRSGAVVTSRLLLADYIVMRGQPVRLRINMGDLTVTGEGKALESGGQGDEVKIHYKATKKNLAGTVIGENLVEVKL